jgi:hypothetical protein
MFELAILILSIYATLITYILYNDNKPYGWFDFNYCQVDELIVYISISTYIYHVIFRTLLTIILN